MFRQTAEDVNAFLSNKDGFDSSLAAQQNMVGFESSFEAP